MGFDSTQIFNHSCSFVKLNFVCFTTLSPVLTGIDLLTLSFSLSLSFIKDSEKRKFHVVVSDRERLSGQKSHKPHRMSSYSRSVESR